MTANALNPTANGELPHLKEGKRIQIAIRLPPDEHQELKNTSEAEERSMSFVALRRYQAGRQIET